MAKLFRKRFRRVLIDVDTQYDLVFDNGRDLSNLLSNTRRLIAWARVQSIPVISTAMTRRNSNSVVDHNSPESLCIEGTPGQHKITYTLLSNRIIFGPENRLDLPPKILNNYQQVIFEKRLPDPFTQPRADRLLSECRVEEFIVFGMDLQNAVKSTVLGLLCRKRKVLLVADAIDTPPGRDALLALRQMEAKGAKLILTADLTGLSKLIAKTPHLITHHHPYHY